MKLKKILLNKKNLYKIKFPKYSKIYKYNKINVIYYSYTEKGLRFYSFGGIISKYKSNNSFVLYSNTDNSFFF